MLLAQKLIEQATELPERIGEGFLGSAGQNKDSFELQNIDGKFDGLVIRREGPGRVRVYVGVESRGFGPRLTFNLGPKLIQLSDQDYPQFVKELEKLGVGASVKVQRAAKRLDGEVGKIMAALGKTLKNSRKDSRRPQEKICKVSKVRSKARELLEQMEEELIHGAKYPYEFQHMSGGFTGDLLLQNDLSKAQVIAELAMFQPLKAGTSQIFELGTGWDILGRPRFNQEMMELSSPARKKVVQAVKKFDSEVGKIMTAFGKTIKSM